MFPGELSWIVLAVAIYIKVVQSGGIRRFKKQRETCSDSSWSCAECLILSTSAFRFASKAPAQRDGWRYEAESAKPCSAARTSCLSFAICSGDNACAIAQADQHRLGAATDNTLRQYYDTTLRCCNKYQSAASSSHGSSSLLWSIIQYLTSGKLDIIERMKMN